MYPASVAAATSLCSAGTLPPMYKITHTPCVSKHVRWFQGYVTRHLPLESSGSCGRIVFPRRSRQRHRRPARGVTLKAYMMAAIGCLEEREREDGVRFAKPWVNRTHGTRSYQTEMFPGHVSDFWVRTPTSAVLAVGLREQHDPSNPDLLPNDLRVNSL